MKQVLFGGIYDLIGVTTSYNTILGGEPWAAGDALIWQRKIVSTSGKIKNLRVKVTLAPGAGKSLIFTLMLNSEATALTLTIADAATSGADTTHEVDVVAGDAIVLRCERINSADRGYATWTVMFEGATAKESLILGGTVERHLSSSATEYVQVMSAYTDPSATEDDRRQVCPTSGTIKNLYVELEDSPGEAPDAYRFTLRKNGESQTLTVTITAPNTTGNDTAHEVAVAAGDVLTLMIEPVETPTVTTHAKWGMTFVADIDGESIVLAGSADDLNPGATEYNKLQGQDMVGDWWATENQRYNLGQFCTLKKLYVLLSAAPGAGKSYTFTLRKPGNGQVDGNLTVTITGAATTGNDTAHTDAISDDDYVDLECTPANTPNVADAYWGVVSYIAIASPAPKGGSMAAKMMAAGVL